jgi:hypothetical protein
MHAEPFEERPVFKIVAPFGIERVRFHSDLDVPSDFDLARIKACRVLRSRSRPDRTAICGSPNYGSPVGCGLKRSRQTGALQNIQHL